MLKILFCFVLPALCVGPLLAQPAQPAQRPVLELRAADQRSTAARSLMLSAALAGQRIVAVGERGTVLLSDDDGASYRQAQHVPAAATLTGVSFVNERLGWAVGHWGLVLHTRDGGENWDIQRSDLDNDQPLLAVHFLDERRGTAVGLWSLILQTEDAGTTWQTIDPPVTSQTRRFDLNLYHLFQGQRGELFASAEQGKLLKSTDAGRSWSLLDTGYTGSLWAGVQLLDGTLLVGGLRGTLLASEDQGLTWVALQTDSTSSITGLHQLADGSVVGAALDGVMLNSRDGRIFSVQRRPESDALTWVGANARGKRLFMSRGGPVSAPQ
jgi:photosystem II stability/assembly factor-like uncharacterized protein